MKYKFILFSPWLLKSPVIVTPLENPSGKPILTFKGPCLEDHGT